MSEHVEAKSGRILPYGALPAPQLTPELLGLVRRGKIYSLSVLLENGMPVPGVLAQYSLTSHYRHGDLDALHPASGASEVMHLCGHTGTHIDALCHIGEWRNGEVHLYGGATGQASNSAQGQRINGAEHLPPIVTRAILLDMARFKGVAVLPDSYEIGGEELAACARHQDVNLTRGCCVLIRTGYMTYWQREPQRFLDTPPGPNLDGASYLAAQGVVVVGSDTATLEAMPHPDHPVHRYLQTEHGIPHMENMWLEDLATDSVWESLLIVLPLRLKGATASPISPIAIV